MGAGQAKPKPVVHVLGLKGCGKSSIMSRVATPSKEIMFGNTEVEVAENDRVKFVSWDIGGKSTYKRMATEWKTQLPGGKGLIWVLDVADDARFQEAADQFHAMLALVPRSVPILFLANKNDLPHKADEHSVLVSMCVDLMDNEFLYAATSAKGECKEFDEGLTWLLQHIPSV